MATNNYQIQTDFPNGLLLDLLIQQMPAVWPADLFPAGYAVRGPPRGVITSGLLEIVTPRDLTPDENTDALARFATHDPADGAPRGVTIATLPSPISAGDLQFVSDLNHATGPGIGTMAYSNGVEWRRVSDDALVV